MQNRNNIYAMMACLLLLHYGSAIGQASHSIETRIDLLYKKFSEGYLRLDPIAVGDCYLDQSVAISHYSGKAPEIITGKMSITAHFDSYFNRLKREKKKVFIEFQITKRRIDKTKAYDVGLYKLISTDSVGRTKSTYGKIAIALVREHGNWKFLTDTNSSASESEYEKAKTFGVEDARRTIGSRVDSLFTVFLTNGLAGSVVVAEKGEVTLRKAYGYANNETKKPNTVTTLFNVASIGKQFTVYAVLDLERKGKLKLSNYLSAYVGAFGDSRDSITLEHLLMHRSGIAKSGVELDYSTREKFIQSIKTASADAFAPGKGYRYSNAGFSMLAAVVEIVAGVPFEEYLHRNIFDPLKMNSAGYPWEKRIDKSLLATGYNSNRQPLPVQEDIWAARGPGNIVTTMEDLYKWINFFRSNEFLPAEMKDKIVRDYYSNEESYGWNKTVTKYGAKLLHKGGGRPDFESRLMWFPEEDVVVIFSLNNDYNLARQLFSIIEGFVN